jgi:two-component system phosphate regulon sensor histidine kinase PhoR
LRGLGLPPKLRLAPLWTALAALLTAAVLLWGLLPGLLAQSAATQLRDVLSILTPLVRERLEAPPDQLAAWIGTLGGREGLRVTVYTADGHVVADTASAGTPAREMPPEVREALTGAAGAGVAVRPSADTGETLVYAAQRIADRHGSLHVLRLAEPLAEVASLRRHVAAVMGFATAAAVAALLLTALWLDRRLFRPLSGLIRGAAQLAAGGVQRVTVPPGDELAALATSLNRLAETAERQFVAVRKERDQLQIILSSMSEGVLVVGTNGRALLANPAFARLFDLAGEVAGRPVLELVRRPELDRLLERTLSSGAPQSGQLEVQAPERRTILLASAALAGGEHGAVIVARDTTELTRVADMRRDFVANVSHELKTPLSAIRAYAETLRDGALEEPNTARRFTDRILWQCRRLQALLADLLTLSRLESVPLAAERELVDLRQLARRTVELLSAMAQERQVTVTLEESEPVPPLPGDADGLERLIVNLLDNAIKYNRPGGEVTVRLARTNDQAIVEVTDTGIGIPPESLSRIFERFYRVDKGRSREEGGTGLGLAIVKHVAQAHGGQVEVESKGGRGSTFRVRLPLAAAESVAVAASSA